MSKYIAYKIDMRSSPDQNPDLFFGYVSGQENSADFHKDIIATSLGHKFIKPIRLTISETEQSLLSNFYFIHDREFDEYKIIGSEKFSFIVHYVALMNSFETEPNKIADSDKMGLAEFGDLEIFRLEFEDNNNLEKNEVESLGGIIQDAIITQ